MGSDSDTAGRRGGSVMEIRQVEGGAERRGVDMPVGQGIAPGISGKEVEG